MVEKIEWAVIILFIVMIWAGWNWIHAYDNTYSNIKTEASVNYYVVNDVARNITIACRKWNGTACYTIELNKFIDQKIKQKNDGFLENMFNWNNDMKNTYENGNDCEGVATLGAGVLKALNVTNVYVIIEQTPESHVFLGTLSGTDAMYFTNYIAGDIMWMKKLW